MTQTARVVPRRRTTPRSTRPSLRLERALLREGHSVLVGMDEVGRGALAGPVSVGVVAVDATIRSAPQGVKDSKLLSQQVRERLAPRIRAWALSWGVGHAWPEEIDAIGIMSALRLAGQRALAQLKVVPDLIVLDGNHDWLTDPARDGLLALADPTIAPQVPVRTMIKADLTCSSVAAASVLAKVTRDDHMISIAPEHPAYSWQLNKGYAAPEHQEALRTLGPCAHHRRSWNITGTNITGTNNAGAPTATTDRDMTVPHEAREMNPA